MWGKKMMMIIAVALIMAPPLSSAQYFQRLYDVDSADNRGWNICVRPDSNYFITGWSVDDTGGHFLFNSIIDKHTGAILDKHILNIQGQIIAEGASGAINQIPGGYILPVTEQWAIPGKSFYYNSIGIKKLDLNGDTVFMKHWSDTAIYVESGDGCAVIPGKGYLVCGRRRSNIKDYFPGLIARTDTLGDTIWTRAYQKVSDQYAEIYNVIPLADGRIVAAGYSQYMADAGGIHHELYYHDSPWFLLLDSMGNIIRDTLYGQRYLTGSNICGELYNDKNGGYINIGAIDTLQTEYSDDLENFPGYIAHLDANFRITWITQFAYTENRGHRQGLTVKQLSDSTYIVTGYNETYRQKPGYMGFAARIGRDGAILWNHVFYSDTNHRAYLNHVAERPGGGLVFVGSTMSDALPSWHSPSDAWLLGTDANGCIQPGGCDPDTGNGNIDTARITAIQNGPSVSRSSFSIFPNPTNGDFTVSSGEGGSLKILDVSGLLVDEFAIQPGTSRWRMPPGVSGGVYLCRFLPSAGDAAPVIARLVYDH